MLVAVITGGSRGLGRQIALTLGKSGYHVAVNYNQADEEARRLELLMGRNALAVKADVGDSKQVNAMAQGIYRQWGRIDVLINNAGLTRDNLLLKYKEDDWDEVLRVNLRGCFNTVRAFAPLMAKSGGGHIVNIASYSGLRGKPGQAAYSASKAGVIGFTCAMARELAEHNIRVNSVLPGYMLTDMGKKAEAAVKRAEQESILKRLSDPAEVAGFISYLLTTGNITGQTFNLDSRI